MNTTQNTPNKINVSLTNNDWCDVVYVRQGDPYGRSAINDKGKPLVEFRLSWICCQYNVDTILDHDGGLVLDCGHRQSTTLNAETMTAVRQWLAEVSQ